MPLPVLDEEGNPSFPQTGKLCFGVQTQEHVRSPRGTWPLIAQTEK